MTEENKEFIDAYIFMTYENMLKTLEKGRLKLLDPEKCNDPFEFYASLANNFRRRGYLFR